MRFLMDGPSIPDELLEERDLGNVVFFCGAGVSLSSGMPSFAGLAEHVVQELDVPPSAPSKTMLEGIKETRAENSIGQPGLDQVFNLLQQEYGPEEIDHQIARRLRLKPGMPTGAHETVLRLSRSTDGEIKVVTTNFDHLFERAAAQRLPRHVHPALPDLARGQPFNGVVYLHGRINGQLRRGEGRQGFVVSSSDFGRAYLSEAWATRFVRDLLDRYIVVLLGYSANDPPVRYLLQGLHSRSPQRQRPIYAFDNGTDDEVGHRWRDTGVSPLSYLVTDEEHSALWNTLKAWAGRADDPDRWRKRIVDLARKGPRELTAAQRGQVVSVVKTSAGAKLFAYAEPPPPGEWLCVLDAEIRYGEAFVGHSEDTPEFDPYSEYGLDDDPPRTPSSFFFEWRAPSSTERGPDLVADRVGTGHGRPRTRLVGASHRWDTHLSSRLMYLARWISQVVHQPVVAWWAAQYRAIHPQLLSEIERRVRRPSHDLPEAARAVWIYLLEKFETAPEDEHDSLLYRTAQRVESQGWTASVLRSFARATRPYLKSAPLHGIGRCKPPEDNWSKLNITEIVRFEVKFPSHAHFEQRQVQIPEETLPTVYRILRRHLELAADLLTEIDTPRWSTKTFYPESGSGGHSYVDDRSRYLFWFRSILDRLVELNPNLIRHDCAAWPEEECFFFDKLRLYVWSVDGLFSAEHVAAHLLEISDEAFWDFYTRRELLMLLKTRWAEFPLERRTAIEGRIANGDSRMGDEESEESKKNRSATSAVVLGWLLLQGCSLGPDTRHRLKELRRADPRWKPEWDKDAASSREGVGGTVRTDQDPSVLLDLPLDDVVRVALENTREPWDELVHYRPFEGLVNAHPARAVAALTNASRQDEHPVNLWASTISCWPDKASIRLTRLFFERLARLPDTVVFELRYGLFRWVEKNLRRIASRDLEGALRIVDSLVDKLMEHPSDATTSSGGEVTIEGKVVEQSRRTCNHAINSPVGCLTGGLIDVLAHLNLAKNAGIPDPLKSRFERLVGLSGEGGDHAACLITRILNGLYKIDPRWTSDFVVPWLRSDNLLAEPAWNGLLHADKLPPAEVIKQIKPEFIDLFPHLSKWSWGELDLERLHEWLVLLCLEHLNDPVYVSFAEAKAALRATDKLGRGQCLSTLIRLTREERKRWWRFVKPFLDSAWPRELMYRTDSVTRRFAEIAFGDTDIFPEVVDGLLPHLRPVSDLNSIAYQLTRGNGTSIAAKFPLHALKLLDALIEKDGGLPQYDIGQILEIASTADPSVLQRRIWKRLNRIARK